MTVNHQNFSYWPTMEPHYFDHCEPEEKLAFVYHPVLLMNSKEDPGSYETKEVKDLISSFDGVQNKPAADRLDGVEKARPFKCEQCSKCFLLKHHLTTHEKTHLGIKPFECKMCGKSFTHKYCLNTHMLLHSNDRPYHCLECKKSFTLKHHLISHKRVHKRDKPFICNECGKGFPLRKQLKTHEKYHNGERPFICKECGDSFAKENHLVMHLRFHGSLNSFACKDCGATFTRKFELVNHGKIHGRQPLCCPICSKEFLQKRTLMTHLKSHSSFSCSRCNMNFTTLEELTTHQNILHPSQQNNINSSVDFTKANSIPANNSRTIFCDLCFKRFATLEELTTHQNIIHQSQHNEANVNSSADFTKSNSPPANSKTIFCDVCFKRFRAQHGLTQHKKRTSCQRNRSLFEQTSESSSLN